jgi:hypothetical protein
MILLKFHFIYDLKSVFNFNMINLIYTNVLLITIKNPTL